VLTWIDPVTATVLTRGVYGLALMAALLAAPSARQEALVRGDLPQAHSIL
jgi:hypothetical protein